MQLGAPERLRVADGLADPESGQRVRRRDLLDERAVGVQAARIEIEADRLHHVLEAPLDGVCLRDRLALLRHIERDPLDHHRAVVEHAARRDLLEDVARAARVVDDAELERDGVAGGQQHRAVDRLVLSAIVRMDVGAPDVVLRGAVGRGPEPAAVLAAELRDRVVGPFGVDHAVEERGVERVERDLQEPLARALLGHVEDDALDSDAPVREPLARNELVPQHALLAGAVPEAVLGHDGTAAQAALPADGLQEPVEILRVHALAPQVDEVVGPVVQAEQLERSPAGQPLLVAIGILHALEEMDVERARERLEPALRRALAGDIGDQTLDAHAAVGEQLAHEEPLVHDALASLAVEDAVLALDGAARQEALVAELRVVARTVVRMDVRLPRGVVALARPVEAERLVQVAPGDRLDVAVGIRDALEHGHVERLHDPLDPALERALRGHVGDHATHAHRAVRLQLERRDALVDHAPRPAGIGDPVVDLGRPARFDRRGRVPAHIARQVVGMEAELPGLLVLRAIAGREPERREQTARPDQRLDGSVGEEDRLVDVQAKLLDDRGDGALTLGLILLGRRDPADRALGDQLAAGEAPDQAALSHAASDPLVHEHVDGRVRAVARRREVERQQICRSARADAPPARGARAELLDDERDPARGRGAAECLGELTVGDGRAGRVAIEHLPVLSAVTTEALRHPSPGHSATSAVCR